jgi:hypothetical protein
MTRKLLETEALHRFFVDRIDALHRDTNEQFRKIPNRLFQVRFTYAECFNTKDLVTA